MKTVLALSLMAVLYSCSVAAKTVLKHPPLEKWSLMSNQKKHVGRTYRSVLPRKPQVESDGYKASDDLNNELLPLDTQLLSGDPETILHRKRWRRELAGGDAKVRTLHAHGKPPCALGSLACRPNT